MTTVPRLALAAAIAALAAQAWAARPAPGALEILRPRSRPAAAGTTGAGFLTLVNHGRSPDALVRVETPDAERVEIHVTSMAGGVMRMAPEARTPIPAGGQVAFAPGGRHLMFVGLKRPLKPGDHVPATLVFASGAQLKTEFAVGSGLGAPMAPAPAEDHMHMTMPMGR